MWIDNIELKDRQGTQDFNQLANELQYVWQQQTGTARCLMMMRIDVSHFVAAKSTRAVRVRWIAQDLEGTKDFNQLANELQYVWQPQTGTARCLMMRRIDVSLFVAAKRT